MDGKSFDMRQISILILYGSSILSYINLDTFLNFLTPQFLHLRSRDDNAFCMG